jgi:hypothetical protein
MMPKQERQMPTLTLEQIAEKAKRHVVTPSQRRAQRVSLIMGVRPHNSNVTREQISSFLDEIEGHEPPSMVLKTSAR